MSTKFDYRLLNENDTSLIFNFNSSIDNLAFVPRSPINNISEAELLLSKFLKSMDDKTAIWWAFYCLRSGKPFGYGGLFEIDLENKRAEIGYGLLKEFWGRGFASSIVEIITRYGFEELKLHRIYGLVDPDNMASLRVLEKNGYSNEGTMHDFFFARGKFFDMCMVAKIMR